MLDYIKIKERLLFCAREQSGCGLCPMVDKGCYATKLKTEAAAAIEELLKQAEAVRK